MPVYHNKENVRCKACGEIPLILKGPKRDLCPVCHVTQFIEKLCTHTKGRWAGKPFILVEWQHEAVRQGYGTLRENGLRQYRIIYIEIPKKNGKTEFAAALALYQLIGDDEPGAEVYSAAADREQAGLVYAVAAQMVRNSPKLSKRLKVIDSRKRIVDYETNSFYQVLSSDVETKHGLNPSGVVFDELHSQPNSKLWDVLTSGTDYARDQQVVIVLTTAGIYDKESIWWKTREKARQIKAGIIEDKRFLPILFIAEWGNDDPEKNDKPDDEELWKRVNPSLGQIFTLEKIREDFATAKNDPAEYNNFLRFRLNIPVNQATRYLPMDHWDACGLKVPESDLLGRWCWGGLDLSSTTDLTAYALVFAPGADGIIPVLVRFYIPGDDIQDRSRKDNAPYDIWTQAGLITVTDGNVADYDAIRADMQKDKLKFDIQNIGFDPWNATQTAIKMQDEDGMTMIETRQGFQTMSSPVKEILRQVKAHKLAHGGHPVLRWCADNLAVKTDPSANVRPAKDKSTGRIDGFTALATAFCQYMIATPKQEITQGYVRL